MTTLEELQQKLTSLENSHKKLIRRVKALEKGKKVKRSSNKPHHISAYNAFIQEEMKNVKNFESARFKKFVEAESLSKTGKRQNQNYKMQYVARLWKDINENPKLKEKYQKLADEKNKKIDEEAAKTATFEEEEPKVEKKVKTTKKKTGGRKKAANKKTTTKRKGKGSGRGRKRKQKKYTKMKKQDIDDVFRDALVVDGAEEFIPGEY